MQVGGRREEGRGESTQVYQHLRDMTLWDIPGRRNSMCKVTCACPLTASGLLCLHPGGTCQPSWGTRPTWELLCCPRAPPPGTVGTIVLQNPRLNGPLRQNKGVSEGLAAPSRDGIPNCGPRATYGQAGPPALLCLSEATALTPGAGVLSQL